MKKIKTMYFSATGNTEKAVTALTEGLEEAAGYEKAEIIDFTAPGVRERTFEIAEDEVLIIGLPVYAGRLPNKILPFVHEKISGKGADAVAVVTFGNRNPDDGLSELVYELRGNGFSVRAAAAVCSEHAFAEIGKGRPDRDELEDIRAFGKAAGEKILEGGGEQVTPEGNQPPGPYYTPKKGDESPAKFLKAKPVTDKELCTECGICASCCPMGSISRENPSEVKGICIKCQACIKKCPEGAKYFDDGDFLSHKAYLEKYHGGHEKSRFYL